MARGLKFRIKVEEELYYPYRENKGADQLRGYREADLRLCFRICKNPVFSRRGSIVTFSDAAFYPFKKTAFQGHAWACVEQQSTLTVINSNSESTCKGNVKRRDEVCV